MYFEHLQPKSCVADSFICFTCVNLFFLHEEPYTNLSCCMKACVIIQFQTGQGRHASLTLSAIYGVFYKNCLNYIKFLLPNSEPMLIQTCTLFSTQAEPFVNFSYYMKTHMSLPVLTTYVREARPFPERMLLCCMKTHISIRRKSSTITTTRHDDKLTNHLQGAMLTYSAPYLSLSCLVMPFLYEVCSTALRQLCTSRSNFSMSLNLM